MPRTNGELLTPKELAEVLRKHVSYCYAMKQAGFPMAAGLATLRAARSWLLRTGFKKSHARKILRGMMVNPRAHGHEVAIARKAVQSA